MLNDAKANTVMLDIERYELSPMVYEELLEHFYTLHQQRDEKIFDSLIRRVINDPSNYTTSLLLWEMRPYRSEG